MDWIFDHLQIIVFIAGIIAYWINQRRREKAGESADYHGDGVPEVPTVRRKLDPAEPDPEEAERTRRIQEEIRRKILQRHDDRPGPAAEPPSLPAPTAPEPRPSLPDPTTAPRPLAGGPLPDVLRRVLEQVRDPEVERRAAAERAVRERQRQLQEQLAALEAERQSAQARATSVVAAAAEATARRDEGDGSLLGDLRGAKNLRRAVVLREVLGPPVGLR